MTSNGSEETIKQKKSLLKRWWLWGIIFIVLSILIGLLDSGGGTAYELSRLQLMSKQEIIDKFGEPDMVLYDHVGGYYYQYDTGFTVQGTDKGATEVILTNDYVKKKTDDSYKIFDVYLGSSFDENVKRLGTPDDKGITDGYPYASYFTKENFILTILSDPQNDEVVFISYTGLQ